MPPMGMEGFLKFGGDLSITRWGRPDTCRKLGTEHCVPAYWGRPDRRGSDASESTTASSWACWDYCPNQDEAEAGRAAISECDTDFDDEDLGEVGGVGSERFQLHDEGDALGAQPAALWQQQLLKHNTGECKPCAWFWKPVGCANGWACSHCHICAQHVLKSKRKARRSSIRDSRREAAIKREALRKDQEEAASNSGPAVQHLEHTRHREEQPQQVSNTVAPESQGRAILRLPFLDVAAGTPASSGSDKHSTGDCSPCVWFWKPTGCNNGKSCTRCHLCGPGEVKQRRRLKVAAMRKRDIPVKAAVVFEPPLPPPCAAPQAPISPGKPTSPATMMAAKAPDVLPPPPGLPVKLEQFLPPLGAGVPAPMKLTPASAAMIATMLGVGVPPGLSSEIDMPQVLSPPVMSASIIPR